MTRFATPADAGAIAEIHVEAWRAAYAGIVPAAMLASLSVADREQQWRRGIESDPRRVLVAVRDGRMAGWIAVGPARDPDGEGAGEVYAIYIRPNAWHGGVGRALMRDGEEEIRRRGFSRTTLWVLEGNARARSFYEHLGYVLDGGVMTVDLGGGGLKELRYAKHGRSSAVPGESGTGTRASL